MELFQSAFELVRSLPADTHGGLVIRHSARFPILNEEDVITAGLTTDGIRQAERFGKSLAGLRQPGQLLSSPIERCQDTLKAIARGAGWDNPVKTDYRLSHPYIERIWAGPAIQWKRDPLPVPLHAILDQVLSGDDSSGSLDIFTTHDTVLAVLASYFTGVSFQYPDYWPNFLEGILIWRRNNQVHLKWREHETILGPWPLEKTGQLALGL